MPNIDMEANKRARKAGYVIACCFSITYGIPTVDVLKFQTVSSLLQWPSGLVVECFTQDQGVAWARHFILLSTGSTKEDQSRHDWKVVDWDAKIQPKQILFDTCKI